MKGQTMKSRGRWVGWARSGILGSTLLAALCAAGPSAQAAARPMRFARLSVENGLSQSTVLSIFQDSVGFMWIGTEDGLNRFDGNSFRVYKHNPGDPSSLPGDFAWGVDEDASGNLWVGTEGGGLARWERKLDRFVRYRHDPKDQGSLPSDQLRTVLVGRGGEVWVGTKGSGLARLDPATGRFTRYAHDPADPASLSDNGVYALLEDKAGNLWVGTSAGLDRLDTGRGGFQHYRRDASEPGSLGGADVRSLFEDAKGSLWVGTLDGGLSELRQGASRFERYRHDPRDPSSLGDDRVRGVLEDRAGRLWVATRSGLDLRQADGRFVHYTHDPANPLSLGDNDVMALFEDRGGVLWAGTRAGGVSRWNPSTWSFGHVAQEPGNPRGLSANYVTSFSEDNTGRLWIGTLGGGLNVLSRSTGQFLHYRADPRKAGSLSDDRVMALWRDREGTLWAGTMEGGLNRLDAGRDTFTVYRASGQAGSLSADAIMSLFEDSDGTLWIGTFRGGLNRMDRRRQSFSAFRHSPSDPKSLSSDIVTSIVEGRSGELWIGTERGGLNRYDPRSGEFVSFRHDPQVLSSLSDDTVYSLHVDPEGTLWVGTRAGLDRMTTLDLAKGAAHFKVYGEGAGLPNDVIYGILPDGAGRLWLSTNGGLVRFDPRTEGFRDYSASHGLQGNEFNFGAHYRSPRGELFFGGPGGLNAFFPERLDTNAHVPPVVLTALLKANRPVTDLGPAYGVEEARLAYRDVVTFEFAALDYAAPERNRYLYKLEGFDRDWIDLGPIHRVTYTNLDAGRYLLRVRAANNDGLWNEEGLKVRVQAVPPPWRSWWAYAAYLLAAGGVVLGLVRRQQRKMAREVEYRRRLELEVEARTQELARQNGQLAKLNEQLVETSLTDSLTGLRNRRYLFEEVGKEMSLVRRQHRERFGVEDQGANQLIFMMIDLDWFKPINDTCGHAAGDRVLIQVKHVLEKACRASDVLIRWGGDEFLVVGRNWDLDGVEALPERIRTMVEEAVFDLGDGQVAHITCSIGFTCYPGAVADLHGLSLEQVVSLADRALYAAKTSGRNAWVGLLGTAKATVDRIVQWAQEPPESQFTADCFEVRRSTEPMPRPRSTMRGGPAPGHGGRLEAS